MWMYYIHHVLIVATLQFTTPFLWPHGIVKHPSDAHFTISVEFVGPPGTFHLLFYEYFEF